ncbi:hypothetical protein FOZ60_011434 [Perkinsus olseni]|uniref:Uncharacterized protein n=1 Tax=Perkinsus olseni TaxID=32597 RepID=A0A7J6ND99_PEROL|nr:hypothetical protein FOZ60_011434 [Perkinsus olseni]
MSSGAPPSEEDPETTQFRKNINVWKDAVPDYSRVGQLVAVLIHIAVSQMKLALNLFNRCRNQFVNMSVPEQWMLKFAPTNMLQYSFLPEFVHCGADTRPVLDTFAIFMERLCSMSCEDIIGGLRYRIAVLIHKTDIPHDRLSSMYSLALIMRGWLEGFPEFTTEYRARLGRYFPWEVGSCYDVSAIHSRIAKSLAGLQYLTDYAYSGLVVQQDRFWSGPRKKWLSIHNSIFNIIFDDLFRPWEGCGMAPSVYEFYTKWAKSFRRGDVLESVIGFVLPLLGDMCSPLMLLVVAIRLSEGDGAVYEIANPGSDKAAHEKIRREWHSALACVTHLHSQGGMKEGHDMWTR